MLGALVILWAIVLVPMWLRRHDRNNEVASADRFAGAMRVLSRRSGSRSRRAEAVSGGRYVMAPPRSSADHEPHVTVSENEDFEVAGPARYAALAAEGRRRIANTKALSARFLGGREGLDESEMPPVERPARGREVSRHEVIGEHSRKIAGRRRLLLAMVVSFVLSLVMAVTRGGLFIGVQAFVDVLMLAGFAHMRAEVVAERARLRRARFRPAGHPAQVRARRQPAAPAPVIVERAVPVEAAHTVVAPAMTGTDDRAGAGPRVARSARGRSAAIPVAPAAAVLARPVVAGARPVPAAAASSDSAAASSGSVPSAPAATSVAAERPRRTVDLTQPGKWSERQAQAAAELPVEEPMRAYVTEELVADQRAEREEIEHTAEFELDLILGRAVGE